MFEKLTMMIIKAWTRLTTPEKKGYLKRVHVTKGRGNKIRKMVVYYPSGDRMPEYEVVS